jgi:predicted PhzF superfamily epimerase YddE/YHI9
MKLPLYQLDAFSDRPFAGNPAAVCPLESWLPEATMQAIATENNLSETAFFVPEGERYGLRWFTPLSEIDLCGHATLATAYVVFRFLKPGTRHAAFRTEKAGILEVTGEGDLLSLDFPSRPPAACVAPPALAQGLGRMPEAVFAARDYLAVYGSAQEVAALEPDFKLIAGLDRFAVIVTAPGEDGVDFVSRFFAPAKGVDEDPVTGSSHCTLIPYWAGRLGKTRLQARQVSRRGGTLFCEHRGERVTIAGKVALYMTGNIEV